MKSQWQIKCRDTIIVGTYLTDWDFKMKNVLIAQKPRCRSRIDYTILFAFEFDASKSDVRDDQSSAADQLTEEEEKNA